MTAHQEHLSQLIMKGGPGSSFLPGNEHIPRQITDCFHTVLYFPQSFILLPQFLRHAELCRHIHRGNPIVCSAVFCQLVYGEAPYSSVRRLDIDIPIPIFTVCFDPLPEARRIGKHATSDHPAEDTHLQISKQDRTVFRVDTDPLRQQIHSFPYGVRCQMAAPDAKHIPDEQDGQQGYRSLQTGIQFPGHFEQFQLKSLISGVWLRQIRETCAVHQYQEQNKTQGGAQPHRQDCPFASPIPEGDNQDNQSADYQDQCNKHQDIPEQGVLDQPDRCHAVFPPFPRRTVRNTVPSLTRSSTGNKVSGRS